jgi:hypothetical protein
MPPGNDFTIHIVLVGIHLTVLYDVGIHCSDNNFPHIAGPHLGHFFSIGFSHKSVDFIASL